MSRTSWARLRPIRRLSATPGTISCTCHAPPGRSRSCTCPCTSSGTGSSWRRGRIMSEYRLTWRVDQDERLNIVDYPDRAAALEHAVELSEENPGHYVDVLETKASARC